MADLNETLGSMVPKQLENKVFIRYTGNLLHQSKFDKSQQKPAQFPKAEALTGMAPEDLVKNSLCAMSSYAPTAQFWQFKRATGEESEFDSRGFPLHNAIELPKDRQIGKVKVYSGDLLKGVVFYDRSG